MEDTWSQKVEAAKADAQKTKAVTEKKVGSVIERLHQLTEREATREAQRGAAPIFLSSLSFLGIW